jgi:hypothetical protein
MQLNNISTTSNIIGMEIYDEQNHRQSKIQTLLNLISMLIKDLSLNRSEHSEKHQTSINNNFYFFPLLYKIYRTLSQIEQNQNEDSLKQNIQH